MADRLVVTGLGAVSALGLTAEENWLAARDGVNGIQPTDFDSGPYGSGVRTNPAAMVKGDAVGVLEAAFGRRIAGSLDPVAVFALKAAHEALGQAGLLGQPLGPRCACVIGNGIGGLQTLEKGYERLFGMRAQKVHPLTIPRVMVSAPVSAIAIEFGVTGPVFATSSACASAAHAIAQGAAMITAGLADLAVVGGSEAMACPGGMRSWEGLQAMSETTCRPFSKGRDGMSIGEGGAALVLERESHAAARGATPLAYYLGAGMTSDAFHWTQPSLEGALGCMRQACEAGGFFADESVLISAHGTGTPLNDKNEAAAIRELFGERASAHPVIATKSSHGHVIGASPAVQAVIALQGLTLGLAPPILGYLGEDEDCAGLDLVLGAARPIASKSLLVNAFAFGGLNCSLAFRI
ncbi:MAG TPA: beta-ketoacyl-[acyl-carrier-protein] synthase family protein [Caulobacteraceae bacterium]|jgi:nodulation protein E